MNFVVLFTTTIQTVSISKTWFQENVLENVHMTPHYSLLMKSRNNGHGGGVVLYVKFSMNASPVNVPVSEEHEIGF